jgi:hypothetical protein
MAKVNKIFALESLRGIAAICVALFHYPSNSFLHFKYGHLGVYFFFVLSGFVISLNYIDKINNFKDLVNFQIRRFWRLYPTHIVVLFIILFIQISKFFAVNYIGLKNGQIPFGDWYSLKDFFASLFLIQSIFNYFYFLSWNGAAWSISTEFYAYIIFAALFMSIKKKFIPFVIIIYLLNRILNFFNLTSLENFFSFLNPIFFICIYYFSIGCFLYHVYKYLHNKIFINNFFSILLFIFLILLKLFRENIFIEYNSIIFSLIILVAVLSEKNTYLYKVLNFNLLIFLGTISYSFYLIHQAVIYLFIQFCKFILKIQFHVDIVSGSVSATGNVYYDTVIHISYVALAICIAYFLFKYVEKPFRKK